MKKLIVSIVVVGTFILYSLIHGHTSPTVPTTLVPRSSSAPTFTPANPTTTASGASGGSPTATPGSQYHNGSYTGSVADAQWGYVQVKAVIQGGKITDVQWVQYPNDRSRSIEINSYADPILTSEAIQAQSAQVDIVTGATDSSFAFMQSLGDALAQAQA
jgi:uncharacterized protein with FMN-binding domain